MAALVVVYAFVSGTWALFNEPLSWAAGIALVILGAIGLTVLLNPERWPHGRKDGLHPTASRVELLTAAIGLLAAVVSLLGLFDGHQDVVPKVSAPPYLPCQAPPQPAESPS